MKTKFTHTVFNKVLKYSYPVDLTLFCSTGMAITVVQTIKETGVFENDLYVIREADHN